MCRSYPERSYLHGCLVLAALLPAHSNRERGWTGDAFPPPACPDHYHPGYDPGSREPTEPRSGTIMLYPTIPPVDHFNLVKQSSYIRVLGFTLYQTHKKQRLIHVRA